MTDQPDLFPSSPNPTIPRIVELRARYEKARAALDIADMREDDFGEPIPKEIHYEFREAQGALCREEARVAGNH
jgi:hypothetical protein